MQKMFKTTTHDFGTVARGTKAEYRFVIKNVFEEDARIVSVVSSCHCIAPQITRRELKSQETSEIIAELNTRDFQGPRTVTLTVTMECVSRATIELRLTGDIRVDVVTQPGAIDFGSVDFGTTAERPMQVKYAGRADWRIVDARTMEDYFEVEMTETNRGAGRVGYELLVRLTKDAPIGYIKDQLILVTNDPKARELPITLSGHVVPDITIHPSKLFMGVVHPGEQVPKTIVVRGKKPFRILDVECPDKSFTIKTSKEAKVVHLIPVVFTAGDNLGRVSQKINIRTDQGKDVGPAFTAFAEVVRSGTAAGGSKPGEDDGEQEPVSP